MGQTSMGNLIGKALSVATRVDLLAMQGAAIVLTVLAMGLFTIVMGIGVLSLAVLTGFSLVTLVIGVVGFVIWLVVIIGIAAFINGAQYHLVLQAVSGKPIDFHSAWRLSSARWVDAFKLQCYIFTGIIFFFLVAFAPAVWSVLKNFPSGLLSVLANPVSFWSSVGFSIILLAALLVLAWPFLILIPPTVYFEQAHPLEIVSRVRKYLDGNYWRAVVFGVFLLVVNSVIGWVADFFSFSEVVNDTVSSAPFVAVLFIGVSFVIQVLAILYTTTFSISAVSLFYLDVGKPKKHHTFVTKGSVSTALSRLARSGSHSPSVEWKWPEKKPVRKQPKRKLSNRKPRGK